MEYEGGNILFLDWGDSILPSVFRSIISVISEKKKMSRGEKYGGGIFFFVLTWDTLNCLRLSEFLGS